jgi:hypothetical protein
MANSIAATRSLTILMCDIFARQPGVDKAALLRDFKSGVDLMYPQDAPIPDEISDALAQLHRALGLA